jgi:uncharacterized protein YeaO (DUF488 family)
MKIVIKRAYEMPAAGDGYRVLVDRLWPRGVKKEALALDEWCKAVAPSAELREWFGHDPARFEEFKARYLDELSNSQEPQALLKRTGDAQTVTLVYSAKDQAHNQAVVLQNHLEQLAAS